MECTCNCFRCQDPVTYGHCRACVTGRRSGQAELRPLQKSVSTTPSAENAGVDPALQWELTFGVELPLPSRAGK